MKSINQEWIKQMNECEQEFIQDRNMNRGWRL